MKASLLSEAHRLSRCVFMLQAYCGLVDLCEKRSLFSVSKYSL